MIVTIIKGLLFTALLVYAAVTDIRRREIDDWVCVSVLIVSLIGTGGSFGGAVITALPFFIPAILKSGSVGGGDIKLMFACGAVLSIWGGITQIVVGLSFAVLYGLILRISKGYKLKETQIPLAPFLCAGGIAGYLWVLVSYQFFL